MHDSPVVQNFILKATSECRYFESIWMLLYSVSDFNYIIMNRQPSPYLNLLDNESFCILTSLLDHHGLFYDILC